MTNETVANLPIEQPAAPPCILSLCSRALTPADAAIDLAYCALWLAHEEMLAEEGKAREGASPEGVHQMRVATRRIRAICRAFGHVLPGKRFLAFNKQFKWLAGVLGEVRDIDVYQENLKGYAAEISDDDAAQLTDYHDHLQRRRRLAREKLVECLGGRRYAKLKHRFARVLGRGPSRAARKAAGGTTIAAAAAQFIGKQHQRVLRDGRAITDDSPEAALHRLRIQCKRLRYLFEIFQPIYGKPLKSPIKRLKSLQAVLGDLQDAHVATQQLRAFAEQVPARAGSRGLLLALGQLISAQQQHAAAHRKAFEKAWKKFDRGVSRKKLIKVLGEPQVEEAPPPGPAVAPTTEQAP